MTTTTQRIPLLSDENLTEAVEIIEVSTVSMDKLFRLRDIYEAARAKDAELIQRLVNVLHFSHTDPEWPPLLTKDAIDAAAAAGYKPSEQ